MPKTAVVSLKYHNRFKVLMCYALAWGLALLLPTLGLRYLYPYKLAGTAPALSQTITALLPEAAQGASVPLPPGADAQTLQAALNTRDLAWRYIVSGVTALAWALSLVWQLLWRVRFSHPGQAARAALRARRSYRLSMAGIWALNLLAAALLYLGGVRQIADRGLWDYLLYFTGFVLNPLAAMLCFRLAAPPSVSGRHAFFRRL